MKKYLEKGGKKWSRRVTLKRLTLLCGREFKVRLSHVFFTSFFHCMGTST